MPLSSPPPHLRLRAPHESPGHTARLVQPVALLTAMADIIAPVADLEKIEKATPRARLVAITHGDPSRKGDCGRPITYRPTRVTEKRSADRVAVCPLHGDLLETTTTGDGYAGAFAFFADDSRPRRRSE